MRLRAEHKTRFARYVPYPLVALQYFLENLNRGVVWWSGRSHHAVFRNFLLALYTGITRRGSESYVMMGNKPEWATTYLL